MQRYEIFVINCILAEKNAIKSALMVRNNTVLIEKREKYGHREQ
jgi:hypothetical protein